MTESFPPMTFDWTGEAFVPLHPRRADKYLTVGQRYTLAQHFERSTATHNHEFAWLSEAWQNIPEAMADRWPTPEHLRKWALIRAGYSDSHTITCNSKAEAAKVAAFIRPIDEFAVVILSGPTVTRYTAKSQSRRAMGAADFQRSKEMIMEIIAKLIGVEPAALSQARAA
jgi:hypothetical protein